MSWRARLQLNARSIARGSRWPEGNRIAPGNLYEEPLRSRDPRLSGPHQQVVQTARLILDRGGSNRIDQSSGITEAYGEQDREWLERYAAAVGHVFGFTFRHQRQERELRELLDAPVPDDAPEILGDSAHIQALRRALHETYIPSLDAENPEPILILGERGTGKDLVARYLHAYSSRRRKPLVVVNCAEITDELAASRFFGHKRGSFTED